MAILYLVDNSIGSYIVGNAHVVYFVDTVAAY